MKISLQEYNGVYTTTLKTKEIKVKYVRHINKADNLTFYTFNYEVKKWDIVEKEQAQEIINKYQKELEYMKLLTDRYKELKGE